MINKTDTKNTILNITITISIIIIVIVGYTVFIKYTSDSQSDSVEKSFGKVIQVEILNGTELSGLAIKFKGYLRSKKIDVVRTGNYTSINIENSFVIDRLGNDKSAKTIAKLLGINSNRIISEPKPDSLIEVSIVLGKDFKQLKVE